MSSANQLFLLADHIKLSLLERRRAQALHLDDDDSAGPQDDAQDGHISRSLDQFRTGLAALRQEHTRLDGANDESASAAPAIAEALPSLQKQLDDLTSQFHGFANPSAASTLTSPNSASLAPDFAHAASTKPPSASSKPSKTVRFSDTPPSPRLASVDPNDADPERGELFGPYHDDPSAAAASGYRDQAQGLSNQQIHEYHTQILEEQDDHLDRLGASIGRQRELSLQIGDELDSHVAMLDDVDAAVDRHQTRLDRAQRALGRVARKANDNKQITAIVVLIIILVLLIAILK